MNVPFLDLKLQYQAIKEEIQSELNELYESQMFILGPMVETFEKRVAEYSNTAFACGVSSGSDALILALMAENIGAGDEVITTPYTFFATAGAIARVGATPVFVDIEPNFYSLDATKLEAAITPKTKAIIPVHLYGQMADMDAICAIAKKHDICVIEDSAQAIGAEHLGRRTGYFGDYTCLSFFPSKNLGGFGDAGMVITNDEKRFEKLKILRNHGMNPKYYHHIVGGNFRIDTLQATVLNVKLNYLDEWTRARQQNADDYRKLLKDIPGLALPAVAPWATRHTYNQFVIRMDAQRRQSVWDGMKKAGIGCDIYYPVPLHLQECFNYLGYKQGDFPNSERAANETLAIPIFPELTHVQKQYVASTIAELMK